MRIEMVDPMGQIMNEIARPDITRDGVAATYAFGLRQSAEMDWRKVNDAILERWSMAGLRYIKERAWHLAQPTHSRPQGLTG